MVKTMVSCTFPFCLSWSQSSLVFSSQHDPQTGSMWCKRQGTRVNCPARSYLLLCFALGMTATSLWQPGLLGLGRGHHGSSVYSSSGRRLCCSPYQDMAPDGPWARVGLGVTSNVPSTSFNSAQGSQTKGSHDLAWFRWVCSCIFHLGFRLLK